MPSAQVVEITQLVRLRLDHLHTTRSKRLMAENDKRHATRQFGLGDPVNSLYSASLIPAHAAPNGDRERDSVSSKGRRRTAVYLAGSAHAGRSSQISGAVKGPVSP